MRLPVNETDRKMEGLGMNSRKILLPLIYEAPRAWCPRIYEVLGQNFPPAGPLLVALRLGHT